MVFYFTSNGEWVRGERMEALAPARGGGGGLWRAGSRRCEGSAGPRPCPVPQRAGPTGTGTSSRPSEHPRQSCRCLFASLGWAECKGRGLGRNRHSSKSF